MSLRQPASPSLNSPDSRSLLSNVREHSVLAYAEKQISQRYDEVFTLKSILSSLHKLIRQYKSKQGGVWPWPSERNTLLGGITFWDYRIVCNRWLIVMLRLSLFTRIMSTANWTKICFQSLSNSLCHSNESQGVPTRRYANVYISGPAYQFTSLWLYYFILRVNHKFC